MGDGHTEDADILCERLNAQGFRVTRISTVGGFLERGNVSILVGAEDERVPAVMVVIKATCQACRTFMNVTPWSSEMVPATIAMPTPVEVIVGGAAIFTLPVIRFLRLRGGSAPVAADEKSLRCGGMA